MKAIHNMITPQGTQKIFQAQIDPMRFLRIYGGETPPPDLELVASQPTAKTLGEPLSQPYSEAATILNEQVVIAGISSAPTELRNLWQAIPINDALAPTPRTQRYWVKQANGVWMPVDLGFEQSQVYLALQKNEMSISDVAPAIRGALEFAELLILASPSSRSKSADLSYRLSHDLFQVVPNLLTPYQLFVLQQQLKFMRSIGSMRLGDRDSSRRAWTHNDVISRWVHLQIAKHVNTYLGTNYVPLFTNFTVYLEGAELPRHRDRYADALSFSAPIWYRIEGVPTQDRWALELEKVRVPGTFHQMIIGHGNGLIFKGGYLDHARQPLPPGHEAAVLLLNFAEQNY